MGPFGDPGEGLTARLRPVAVAPTVPDPIEYCNAF